MRRIRDVMVMLALALPLLAACASGGKRGDNREEAIFVVRNELLIPSPVTIFVVSDVGERHLLGSLVPSVTRELRFRRPSLSGSYRLVARIRRGEEIVSQRVALNGGETVDWNLRNNTLLVRR